MVHFTSVEGHGQNNHMKLPYGRLRKCESLIVLYVLHKVAFKIYIMFVLMYKSLSQLEHCAL